MTAPQTTRVTQADEFRADDFWEETDGLMNATFSDLTKLLARHRQAAEAEAGAREAALREALAMAVGEMMRASGRLETIALCNEDRRIVAALNGTCNFIRDLIANTPSEGASA